MSELVKTHKAAADSRRYTRLDWFWNENPAYEWQKTWWKAGAMYQLRHNSSANRQGKSFSNLYEAALHALGVYPEWWEGKRFDEPTTGIVAGETTESVRDTIQNILLGEVGDFGTGWLPKSSIQNVVTRQGSSGAVDYIIVKRRASTGGVSKIMLKSFDQGPEKIAGTAAHYFSYDENCPLRYFSEAIRALATTAGIVFGAYTPIEYSDLVAHLETIQKKDPSSIFMVYVDFDEARHLDEKTKAMLRSAWAPWEVQARTTGHANRHGAGRIYPVPEEQISVPDFIIPLSWPRLVSMDFGISADPTTAVWRAIDRQSGTTYIYKTYKSKSGDSPRTVVSDIFQEARGIPVAWPHDGNKQYAGVKTVDEYKRLGLKMLHVHATFQNESMKVADGIVSIRNGMESGNYKVFQSCREWFDEFRKYRYDEKGVAKRQDDHIMDADRYGRMMERYAKAVSNDWMDDKPKAKSFDYAPFGA